MAEQTGAGTPAPAKKAVAKKATPAKGKAIPPEAIQKARTEANSAIIEKYRTERDGLIVATLDKQGHKGWKPAPTAEQKAAAQLEQLYTDFPNLRPKAPVEDGDPDRTSDLGGEPVVDTTPVDGGTP